MKKNKPEETKQSWSYFNWNPYPFFPSILDLKRNQIKEVRKHMCSCRKDRLYPQSSIVIWLQYLECTVLLEILLYTLSIRTFQVNCVFKRHREITDVAEMQNMCIKIIGDKVEKAGLCHCNLMLLKDWVGNVIWSDLGV